MAKRSMFKTFMRFLFSHVGLLIMLILYCVLGAWMYSKIEGNPEYAKNTEGVDEANGIDAERAAMVDKVLEWHRKFKIEEKETILKYETDQHNDSHSGTLGIIRYMNQRKYRSDQVEDMIEDMIENYHIRVKKAISNYDYDGTVHAKIPFAWTFTSSLVFTVSCVTVIGYGHVFPVTELGRFVSVPYALLGIPLTLMFLANIGKLFATAVRLLFARGCCRLCYKRRKTHDTTYEIDIGGKYSHRKGEPAPDGFEPYYSPQTTTTTTTTTTNPNDDIEGNDRENNNDIGYSSSDNDEEIMERPGTATVEDTDNMAELAEEIMEEDKAVEILSEGTTPVPIAFTIGIILVYIFIGALFFKYTEDWGLVESAYFCFVTLSTIGFGDLVPGFKNSDTVAGQMKLFAAAIYIVLGLAVLSMGFDLIIVEIMTKAKVVGEATGVIDDDEEEDKNKTSKQKERFAQKYQ